MKKHVVLTSVASLLTLASVAVLPAFALDTGGVRRWNDGQGYQDKASSVTKSYNFKKGEDFSRSRGEHERYGKEDRRHHGGYRNAEYGKNEYRGEGESHRWGHGKKEERGERRYGHGGSQEHGDQGGRAYASR